MSRWHLVNPMGVSERTTEADSEFWAKRRFAPIPKGWYVQSDASYRIPMYQVKPELLTVCSKCNRHPAVEGRNQCEACASHKRNAYRKQHGLDPLAPVKEHQQRRSDLANVELRQPNANTLTTRQAAKRIGCATNTLHGLMKSHGYLPCAGYAREPGKLGRGERLWVAEEVQRVANIRRSKLGRTATILRGIAHRRAKREGQLSLFGA